MNLLHSSIPLSVPAPGRTIQSLVSSWESSIIDVHKELLLFIRHNKNERELIDCYNSVFTPLIPLREFKCSSDTEIHLATASIITIWILARLNISGTNLLTYSQAEKWFFGNKDEEDDLLFSKFIPNTIVLKLNQNKFDVSFHELLPYILELFELSANNTSKPFQQHKKSQGLFYTPSDLADYMVEKISKNQNSNISLKGKSWIDASCGSGVFLLSILKIAAKNNIKDIVEFFIDSVYGLDISPFAVNSSAFVLTNFLIGSNKTSELSPWLIWQIVRGNLAVIDTTLLGKECLKSQESNNYKKNRNSIKGNIKNTRKRYLTNTNLYSFDPSKFFANRYFQEENFLSIFDIFPERSEGFDFFVGNPPYSAFQDPQYKYIRQVLFKSIEDGTKGNTYAFFIEAMWNFTKRKNAKAALVVPLSISYSMDKSIKKLRNLIEASNWHFRFSFYDRTPDSLFGDAVKTRSCIIELHKSQNTKTIIETSGIIRWNSRNRSSLFKNLKFTTLSSHSIKEFIPKLSSSMERVVYQNLVNNPKKLGSIWKTVSPNVLSNLDVNASPVYYYNVAYNWISCFRKIPADKDGNLVLTNSLRAVVCRNERESDFLFAVLTSRLVYWLWRVEGDGFHVTQSFLNRIPIHPSQFHQRALKRLSNLSDMLWNDLLKNSIISINSGKKTINYSPKNSSSLIDQIDEEIIASLNIPREFGEYLRDYVQENIIVGRQDEITKRGT